MTKKIYYMPREIWEKINKQYRGKDKNKFIFSTDRHLFEEYGLYSYSCYDIVCDDVTKNRPSDTYIYSICDLKKFTLFLLRWG